jgi:L-alanine-DL-glutamate epimerase-like enolase superfamily enzyme
MAGDIAVVHGVREAIGSDVTIMLDANNGYNDEAIFQDVVTEVWFTLSL